MPIVAGQSWKWSVGLVTEAKLKVIVPRYWADASDAEFAELVFAEPPGPPTKLAMVPVAHPSGPVVVGAEPGSSADTVQLSSTVKPLVLVIVKVKSGIVAQVSASGHVLSGKISKANVTLDTWIPPVKAILIELSLLYGALLFVIRNGVLYSVARVSEMQLDLTVALVHTT